MGSVMGLSEAKVLLANHKFMNSHLRLVFPSVTPGDTKELEGDHAIPGSKF